MSTNLHSLPGAGTRVLNTLSPQSKVLVDPFPRRLMDGSGYNEIRMDGVRFDALGTGIDTPLTSRIANASYCYCVRSGPVIFEIRDEDPVQITAGDGDILAVSGLTPHNIHIGKLHPGAGRPLTAALHPLATLSRKDIVLYVGEVRIAELGFLGSYVGPQHITRENHPVFNKRIWRTLKIIDEETRAGDDYYEVAVRLQSETILLNLMRFVEQNQGAAGVASLHSSLDKRILRVMLEIGKEPARAWTVAELASLANMSRTAFATGFHKLLGVTPMEAVTQARLARGIFALDNTQKSIEDIAFSCGYSSSSAFVRAFKRSFNMTPLQRRKQHRN